MGWNEGFYKELQKRINKTTEKNWGNVKNFS